MRGTGPALGGGPAPMAATPSVARQDHAPEATGFAAKDRYEGTPIAYGWASAACRSRTTPPRALDVMVHGMGIHPYVGDQIKATTGPDRRPYPAVDSFGGTAARYGPYRPEK
ncbi:hypothetical protein GCM10027176_29990 [Actinoallomurus bryophytorum]